MNQHTLEAVTSLTAIIARCNPSLTPFIISRDVLKLSKLASSLHKRYSNGRNYQWATGDKYDAHTEKLENKTKELGVNLGVRVEPNRDPRTSALKVIVEQQEVYLG